ncbi:MAG: TlpA disulfide reductase family protein [Planctomycetota bacterium]
MEAPHFSKLHDQFASEGLVVIGINGGSANPNEARDFARQLSVTHPMVVDGATLAVREFGAVTRPSIVAIDRQGKVAAALRTQQSYAELEKLTRRLLGKS